MGSNRSHSIRCRAAWGHGDAIASDLHLVPLLGKLAQAGDDMPADGIGRILEILQFQQRHRLRKGHAARY